jgi:hypothetical protein
MVGINAFRLEAQFVMIGCKSIWKCLLLAQSDSDFHKFIVDMVCSPIDFILKIVKAIRSI